MEWAKNINVHLIGTGGSLELVSGINFRQVAVHKGCSTSQSSTMIFSPAVNKSNQDGDQHDATRTTLTIAKNIKKPHKTYSIAPVVVLKSATGKSKSSNIWTTLKTSPLEQILKSVENSKNSGSKLN